MIQFDYKTLQEIKNSLVSMNSGRKKSIRGQKLLTIDQIHFNINS